MSLFQIKLKRSKNAFYLTTTKVNCSVRQEKTDDYYIPTSEEEKSKRAIRRAKNRIFELADCNDWTNFLTITLDPKKHDRFDYSTAIKNVLNFFYNLKEEYSDFRYLIVPEPHKSGAIHFHGLLYIPQELHDYLQVGKTHNKKNRHESAIILDKFGYNNLKPLRNTKGVAAYIVKYITKDTQKLCDKRFYHSQDLKSYEEISSVEYEKEFNDSYSEFNPDYADSFFANIYCTKVTCYTLETLMRLIEKSDNYAAKIFKLDLLLL